MERGNLVVKAEKRVKPEGEAFEVSRASKLASVLPSSSNEESLSVAQIWQSEILSAPRVPLQGTMLVPAASLFFLGTIRLPVTLTAVTHTVPPSYIHPSDTAKLIASQLPAGTPEQTRQVLRAAFDQTFGERPTLQHAVSNLGSYSYFSDEVRVQPLALSGSYELFVSNCLLCRPTSFTHLCTRSPSRSNVA